MPAGDAAVNFTGVVVAALGLLEALVRGESGQSNT